MAYLESQMSEQVFAMLEDNLAPDKVAGLIFNVEQGKVNLSWDAVTTNADGSPLTDLDSYHIFRKDTQGDTFVQIGQVDAEQTSYTDETAKDGATYYYAVAAFDTQATPNEGLKSDALEVKTIPSVPTGLSALATENAIELDWVSVKDETDEKLNENLAGYNIYRSEVDGGEYEIVGTASAEQTTYEDTDVNLGVTYYYVITAFDNSL